MTVAGVCTFATLRNAAGDVEGRYQNSPIPRLELEGASYDMLSFFYEGSMRDRLGDNLQAEMVLANNEIAMQIVQAAVRGRWLMEFATCAMHPETFAVGRVLSREIWAVVGPSYNPAQITVELASALDAVGASAPTITLTSSRVGALPVSGSIRNI